MTQRQLQINALWALGVCYAIKAALWLADLLFVSIAPKVI